MSTNEAAILRYRESVVWAAVLIGIPAWMIHLVFEAAMVQFTTTHAGWRWTMHLATAVTALVTLAGMAICYDLLRVANRADSSGLADESSPATLSRFLGVVGLMIGASNLALILLEGSYVIFVRRGG